MDKRIIREGRSKILTDINFTLCQNSLLLLQVGDPAGVPSITAAAAAAAFAAFAPELDFCAWTRLVRRTIEFVTIPRPSTSYFHFSSVAAVRLLSRASIFPTILCSWKFSVDASISSPESDGYSSSSSSRVASFDVQKCIIRLVRYRHPAM